MADEIQPFADERRLRMDRRRIAALERADCVVVEPCTDKHYEADGWTLNVNALHWHPVRHGRAAAGQQWWKMIGRQHQPTEALALDLEVALRAN